MTELYSIHRRPIVVIESPFRGCPEYSNAKAKLYLTACIRDSIDRGEAPFASHRMYTQALDDSVPEERKIGISVGLQFHRVAERIVFYTDLGWSDGMMQARGLAEAVGFPIDDRSIDWSCNIA
jgi:hypothetical protein